MDRKSFHKFALSLLIRTAIVLILVFGFIGSFAFRLTPTSGTSMYPTIISGDYVFVSGISYWFNAPKRGELISFNAKKINENPIKRIIGLPGDTIEIHDNMVFVNENPIEEPYIFNITDGKYGPVVVPENHVFVLGDNRGSSMDSRDSKIGMVSKKSITGKVILCSWPLKRVKILAYVEPKTYNN